MPTDANSLISPVTINFMSETDIQHLFAETLRGNYEDEAPWDAVRKLRQLGTREVFDVAARWCSSTDPLMRARGIDVLAQLGKTVGHPTNSFPDESYSVVTNRTANMPFGEKGHKLCLRDKVGCFLQPSVQV